MEILQEFFAYAGEFEKTLKDDDWTRLRRFFADDAVYEVEAPSFGCRLVGPDAIFRGIKKSLDSFDRKFEGRGIDVTSGPTVTGDEIRLGWTVTYEGAGLKPFVLRGRSLARYAGGRIAYLRDSYDASVERELAEWQRENAVNLDVSYT
jgi:hypothetical protein